MPMNAAVGEAVVAITAPGIPAVLALAATDPGMALDLLPVSAGLSGAVVATMKAHLLGGSQNDSGGRLRWLSTIVSGASAAVFVTPALADALGYHAIRGLILWHFIVGLVGSSLCDLILANASRINGFILSKVTPGLQGGGEEKKSRSPKPPPAPKEE